MNHGLLAFNGGELSPYGRHRIDFEKNPTGAEEMTNFLPNPFGPMTKRPGLEHVSTFTHDTDEGKAFPFKSSDGTKYVVCIDEDNGITIVRAADGTVADTLDYLADANIPDNFTPGTDDLRDLQFLPVNDVAFLTHPKIAPCRLTRTSDTAWTVEPIPFDYSPLAEISVTSDKYLTAYCMDAVLIGAWSGSSVAYKVGNRVTYGGSTFVCLKAHTSTADTYPVDGATLYPVPYSGTPSDGYYEATDGPFRLLPYWLHEDKMPSGPGLLECLPGSEVTFYSNNDEFNSDMVGAVFYCARGKRSWDTDSIDLNATSRYSEVLLLEKSWQVETAGTWVGTLTLELSTNGFDWQTVRQWESKSNRNINDSGEVTSPHWMRLRWVSGGAGASNPMATIDSLDSYFDGFFKIDAVTDARNATGTTLRYFDGASVDLYAEAAFTKNQGFPKTACLHEGRLCFASTDRQPNSIWLSQSDDYLNFRTGTDDNEGIARTLQAPFSDPILWLASQRRLFIGTSKAEYVSGSETSDQPLTPSNFVARKYTNAGSSRIPPLVYDDGVIFAGRGGGRIHEIGFEIERSSYAAEDLSRLAEHITAAGVQAMDFQQTREPRLWLVRSDGALLCLAYNRKERLAAWSKITTQAGSFTDVVVFAGDDGDDEVYFLIKRGSSTCLERFPAGWQAAQEENNGWLAVDGVMGTGTNITVPAHLQDTDITLLLNGDTNPVATAVNYSSSPQVITSADWQIGFPIVAQYQSLPIDAGAEDGSTLSRRKRIHKASLSLYQSRGGSTWNKASGNKQAIPNTQASEVLRTGWEDVILDPGHLDDVQLRIYHADPFPFTVRAAALRWRVTE